ncbi:MAG: hypothetical protein FWD36_07785 [Treponema sp.]|nr:hypothetical protein [Treponema sp.]
MAVDVFGLIPLIFGIIFAGIGIALPIHRKKQEKEFNENGIPVTAVINNVWRTGSGKNWKWHVSVVFKTKDNEEIITELSETSTRMKKGQYIDIKYHKNDAYNVYVESAVVTNVLMIIFCTIGFAAIGLGLYGMLTP